MATAQPSGIQKRLASTNEEKKHQNVCGVAVAANGAPKEQPPLSRKISRKTNRAKERTEMQLGETSRQLMAKQHAISFVPEIN
jgi:hypothetical protein